MIRLLGTLRGFWAAALLLSHNACTGTSPRGPYEGLKDGDRSSLRAEELTVEAVEIADAEPARAETLLREALTADLYHGPAHNNLGVLYFREGKLYEAANEFEWARKLMPGHPDPRLNLALVLERAGHVAEAFDAFEAALEVAPEHVPTMQAYAGLAIRQGRSDSRTLNAMKAVALKGETDAWRRWAQSELARHP